MKIKIIMIAVLLGFLSLTANAGVGFSQFADPSGAINVYALQSPVQDLYTGGPSWEQWMAYDLEDVIVETTNFQTLVMKPNISAYATEPGTYASGGDGTKTFAHLNLYEHTVSSLDSTATMDFDVTFNGLDQTRYKLYAVFRMIDSSSYEPYFNFESYIEITSNGTYNLESKALGAYASQWLHAGFVLWGRNAAPGNSHGSVTINLTNLNVNVGFSPPPPRLIQ